MNKLQSVYENEEIVIIRKPIGLASQGGKGIKYSADMLLSEQMNSKMHLVHRLDKETEGLLIVAKNPIAAAFWTSLIASKDIVKEYRAICVGELERSEGFFSNPITKKGIEKDAKTYFTVLKKGVLSIGSEASESVAVSLLSLRLETGRMHQIRIHLSQNGTPIIADDKYGDFKLNKKIKKQCAIKKLQLTACLLEIPAYALKRGDISVKTGDDEMISFEIPLPVHMEKAFLQFGMECII